MKQVGREELVAHISELLDQVEHGEEVELVRDGNPVLRLVPAVRASVTHDVAAARRAVESIREFREKLAAEGKFLTLAEIRSLIDEGRRY